MDEVLAAQPPSFAHAPRGMDLDNILVGDAGEAQGGSFLSRFFSSPSPSPSMSASPSPPPLCPLAPEEPSQKRSRVGDANTTLHVPSPPPPPGAGAVLSAALGVSLGGDDSRSRKRGLDDVFLDDLSLSGTLASGTSSESSPHSLEHSAPLDSAGLFDPFADLAPLSDARMDPDFHVASAASPQFPHNTPPHAPLAYNPLAVECEQRLNEDIGIALGPVAPGAVSKVFHKPAHPARIANSDSVAAGGKAGLLGMDDDSNSSSSSSSGSGGSAHGSKSLGVGASGLGKDLMVAASSAGDTPSKISIAFSPHQLTRLSNSPPASIHSLALPGPTMTHPKSKTRQLVRKHPHPTSPAGTGSAAGSGGAGAGAGAGGSGAGTSSSRRKSNARSVGAGGKDGAPKRRFCHVCRSPKDVSKIVSCCSGKQSHVFCSSCVHRRLSLNFDDLVHNAASWLCPKCEGRCPCSKCRKRTDKQ